MISRREMNIWLNGIAVMLAYAGMLGGAIIMPTIFKDMSGQHGLSESTAFYGLMICNTAVVISGPFTPSITAVLGTRTAVILSVFLCGAIINVLFYPTDYLVYTAFLLNGIGCALLRVAALGYVTKNSTRATLSRHSTIHWTLLTVGLMLGNGVVMLLNIHNKDATIGSDRRYGIAVAMTIVCYLAIPPYFFTRKLDETEELVETVRKQEAGTAGIISFPHDHEELQLTHLTVREHMRTMWSVLLRSETLMLIGPMFSAGVYCTAYSPIIPTAIGTVSKKPWLISAFAMCVGVGQLLGALISGNSIERVRMRKMYSVISALSLLTFLLLILILHMGFTERWSQWVQFSEVFVLCLGGCIGACDMGNNVCLTVLIGHVYKEDTGTAFSLFITVMSVSMVIWYLLATFSNAFVILGLYAAVTTFSGVGFTFSVGKLDRVIG